MKLYVKTQIVKFSFMIIDIMQYSGTQNYPAD